MSKEKLLIIDGNSIMNRAFYALPPMTNGEGVHTNAVYGFTTMILKLKEEIKPDYIVCTFDRKAPTFRHIEYEEYKAGRKKMPEELAEQFPIIKQLLTLLSIDIFEIDGFEADDLIGTLSTFAEKSDIEVFILTGDRDALQLATDSTKVIITKKGITEKEIYDRDRMISEYGVTPEEFIDVKGLMGDASDNIPGVPGIGEKTAYKLITEYKSIENVLSNIENIKGNKIKQNLMEYREQAIFSKKLATIIKDVPVDIDMESIKSKENFDYQAVKELFFKLQFKSLIDRIPMPIVADVPLKEEKACDYANIENLNELEVLVKDTRNSTMYMIFTIKDGAVYSRSSIEFIYLNYEDKNFIIPAEKLINENENKTIELLKTLFEGDSQKVIYDVKAPNSVLMKMGIELKNFIFDIKLAAYLIDPSKNEYEITSLIGEYLFKEIKGQGQQLEVNELSNIKELYEVFKENINKLGMEKLLYEVEQPLAIVLSYMENKGFNVHRDELDDLGDKFSKEIENVKTEIFGFAGEEFNISSPKQLGKILFEKLDLPVIKKTKTGYSTNVEVLKALEDKHPIIEKIMYYRQLTKLFSTYVEGLKSVIDIDGRIHSSFNQTVTTTGRLSSTEPNLQNIPIKYEMGREIRKVFVPDNENCILLSADYSQIELRVLAHIADDENLINAFKEGVDIHTKTASEVFKVPIEEVTPLLRSNAKAVNFGIVYGIGDYSLGEDLKISRKEARSYIDAYFERYPNVKKYMEDTVKQAKEQGYVTTILNRRRYIPEIKAPNKMVMAAGERLAMNTPIQGSAADIIKLAMVNVYNEMKKAGLKSSLILQVHDELILNVYKEEIEEVKAIVKKEMEQVMELKVPMVVDINTGDTWYQAK